MSGKSPGQELRASLDATLASNMVWTAQELQTLDSIQDAADRLEAAAGLGSASWPPTPSPLSRGFATIQSALHQLESDLFRWINKLGTRHRRP